MRELLALLLVLLAHASELLECKKRDHQPHLPETRRSLWFESTGGGGAFPQVMNGSTASAVASGGSGTLTAGPAANFNGGGVAWGRSRDV